MTDFSLRRVVRQILDTSDLVDPHDIAAAALCLIQPEHYEIALSQLLPSLVREMIRESRNGGTPPPVTSAAPSNLAALRALQPVLAESPAGSTPVSATIRPLPTPAASSALEQRPAFRSSKVAAYQELGLKWMRERLNTSSDPRGWKLIGDCTFDDLMFAARDRREQAGRTLAKAKQYEELAGLLRAHGASTVRDLPDAILRGVGGEAA